MSAKKLHFGIIGCGSWGLAFAHLLSLNGNNISAFGRGITAPKTLPVGAAYTNKLSDLRECDVIVIALPFQAIRQFFRDNVDLKSSNAIILSLSKGIELGSYCLGNKIITEVAPDVKYAVLSGPNFATEIMLGLPAAAVLASSDSYVLKAIEQALASAQMALELSNDVVGIEICGAVKNVVAIGAGICEGAKYGQNAKAALITRSLAEIRSLVVAMSGKASSVDSSAGIGDLVLTCGSKASRNFQLGYAIGKQGCYGTKLSSIFGTVEGYHTAKAVAFLIEKFGIKAPVFKSVYNILCNNCDIKQIINFSN